MNILYLDSSTEACTAGVAVDDVMLTGFEYAPRGHAQRLMPMAEALLERAEIGFSDLDLVAFGRGPGSFTGVRIATAMAQGIAISLDLPMVGISSLECLALGAWRRYREASGVEQVMDEGVEIRVAIDARMGEIYRAVYRIEPDGDWVIELAEAVSAPDFPGTERLGTESPGAASAPVLACGSGFGRYPELARSAAVVRCEPDALPHAQDALELVARTSAKDWISADRAVPHYLRDNVAG